MTATIITVVINVVLYLVLPSAALIGLLAGVAQHRNRKPRTEGDGDVNS